MLTALTRQVSNSIADCELIFVEQAPIDIALAEQQHAGYEAALRSAGVHVQTLPAEHNLPDAVFVEDCAVVLDEIAVATTMGSPDRALEVPSLAVALASFRPVEHLHLPSRLEGGDVLRIDRTLYVGESTRTNAEGIAELAGIVEPWGYRVISVPVTGCLHLKTGVTQVAPDTLLANVDWVDTERFTGFHILRTPEDEGWGANAIQVNGVLLMPASFPRTRRMLEDHGLNVIGLDVSEFQKAEAGLTCMSIIFNA